MSSKGKIIFIIASAIVCLVVIVFLSGAYYTGAFNDVQLQKDTRGCYHIVFLSHKGPYYLIQEKIQKVESFLRNKRVKIINPCGIYYDDPSTVPKKQLRSKGGYIVDFKVELQSPFEQEHIPKRDVIMATFKGHPAVAAFKIYPKINQWMSAHNCEPAGPALEIYRNDGYIECEMPIQQKKNNPE
ncbi:MAG: GyrI-like domain-containing protein [bacterium]